MNQATLEMQDVTETVRTWKRYPKYKDSGVQGIGDIPADWEKVRLGSISKVIDPQPDHRAPAIAKEEGFPYIGIRDVNHDGTVNIETARKIEEEALLKQESSFTINPGDIVFCKVGTLGYPRHIKPCGRIALSATLVLIKATAKIDNKFLCYSLDGKNTHTQIDISSTGSTRDTLGIQQIRKFKLAFPPLLEQQQIATFLDRETAKIDALIAKKERFIELLQEKRTALISHAVTKGLNPDVPMKDSGIEWLGEIPAHWEKTRIKYVLYEIIDTEHKTVPFYQDGEYLVVRTSNVKNGQLILDDAKYTNNDGFIEWTRRGIPISGDILFTREAPAGEACLVPENMPLCLGQRMVLLRVNHQKLYENYGIWSIYGGIAKEFITLLSQGSTVSHFNMSDISNIPLLLPPIEEQKQISFYLDRETSKIYKIITKTRTSIDHLKEYRTALISAAVTGKIDVREEVA
ncbi:restriction modification system DNA specificity domain protein [Fischerella sp. NIES-4106]|nr:restriction modification system DNA specificity domain protein [Fischerella sp. NIES-4106]